MEIKDVIYKLRHHPRIVADFLKSTPSRYINIYQLSRFMQTDFSGARVTMYDLIDDGLVEKYQTTFRLTNEFMKIRGML